MIKNRRYLILTFFGILSASIFWSCQQNTKAKEQNLFAGPSKTLTALQKDIVKKFRDGNVPGLVEYFDEEVTMMILKESDIYEKKEGEDLLLDFCKNHIAKKFIVKHYGVNQAKTEYYLIADLTTTAAEKFRVYISNNKTKILNIEITKPRDI